MFVGFIMSVLLQIVHVVYCSAGIINSIQLGVDCYRERIGGGVEYNYK